MKNENLLNLNDVIEFTTLSRSMIYLMMQEGRFPKPLKIGLRKVMWQKEDILSWLEKRGMEINFNRKEYSKGYHAALKHVEKIIKENEKTIGLANSNFLINLLFKK